MVASSTLAALYRLNKAAKAAAEAAHEAYQLDDGETARIKSCRKTALYRFKTYVLQQLYAADAVDQIDRHTIDDREYYCLTIDGWQFHTPIDQWATLVRALDADDPDPDVVAVTDPPAPPTPDLPTTLPDTALSTETHLTDFDADAKPTATPDLSLTDALTHLDTHFDASPNVFLDQSFIDVGWHRPDLRFTGWPDLSYAQDPPTPPQEGDQVAEADMDDDTSCDFLFAVDETLDTIDHGPITITDRYGEYTIPFHSQYNWPILQARYDVTIADPDPDDRASYSGVDDERIFGWHVRIDDPADPPASFDGPLADHVQDIDPAFDRGDTLLFEPRTDDGTPRTATVTDFSVWGILIDCHLRWDDGTTQIEPYDDLTYGDHIRAINP